MALTKDDLKEIKKIVGDEVVSSAKRTAKKIDDTKSYLEDRMNLLISKSEHRLESKKLTLLIKKLTITKEEIITRINREVSNLVDVNRAVILRTDELEYRVR